MGILNIKLMGAVAAATLLLTPVANATLMLQISDSADFNTGTVVSATDTDNDGLLTINGVMGSWVANVVTGIGSPLIGDQYADQIHLNSVNVSGGTGTIYIRLTDTGYVRDDRWNTAFGGTTDGTVSFQSYIDSTNAIFGTETLLSNSGDITSSAFDGVDSGGISFSNPYSISIYAAITHDAGFRVSSFDYDIRIPEPSSLALLGLGLLGAGFAVRRNSKKLKKEA